jgi:hypothetical protein
MNFRVPASLSRTGAVLGVAVALLLASGCSKGSDKPAAAPSPPALRCTKAPEATVASTLGTPVNQAVETDQIPVTVCTYPLTSGKGVVVLRFQSVVDSGRFAEIRKGFSGSTTDLAGYHDEAFTATHGSGANALNSVAARKGDVAIVITAPAPVNKEKALIDQLFSTI